MRHRRYRRKKEGDVELNLAAMLDMAFQLLTFFILTFKPSPIEGQVSLHLPPAEPVTKVQDAEMAGADLSNKNPVAGLNSLVVTIYPSPTGQIGTLSIGESSVGGLGQLEGALKTVLSDPGNPFDQVILQVGSSLHYEEMMKVVEICTRQTLPDGKKLSKLSFVELPIEQ